MKQRGFTTIAVTLILLNVGLVVLVIWRITSTQHAKQQKPETTLSLSPQTSSVTRVRTSLGGFSIEIPNDWTSLSRIKRADALVVTGTAQPGNATNDPPSRSLQVSEIDSYNRSSANVFEAVIADNLPSPQGEAVDILVGKGSQLLSGRVIRHTYDATDNDTTRTIGDKDVVYSFALGGTKELRVTYRIYAADSVDNSKVVDTIVKSMQR